MSTTENELGCIDALSSRRTVLPMATSLQPPECEKVPCDDVRITVTASPVQRGIGDTEIES